MKKLFLPIMLTAVFSQTLHAKDQVVLQETYNIEANSTININVAVGELDIETHNGDDVRLEIIVKESDDNWFDSMDLDEAEITFSQKQEQVYFSVDVEDTTQEWKVLVPQNANLDIDMGVGKVTIEDVNQSVNLDLGVGDAEIRLIDSNYNRISLDTGVGDADLDGFSNAETERNIVSENVKWRGEGEYRINVDVGVGDIEVRN